MNQAPAESYIENPPPYEINPPSSTLTNSGIFAGVYPPTTVYPPVVIDQPTGGCVLQQPLAWANGSFQHAPTIM